jgi:hypothetical protein
VPLGFEGEVDHHDPVLLHQADEQDDADDGDHVQGLSGEVQREQCAERGRGQGGEDGDRVDTALVEDAEHDVHGHHRGEHEEERARERGTERVRGPLELHLDRLGQLQLPAVALDRG